DLSGVLFVSSGLGGMSGAQPKAAEIAHAVGVVAEVDMSRIQTRLDQGWVGHVSEDLDEVFALAQKHVAERTPISIAYHGNIVDLLQYAVDHDIDIPLLSDQTSCHAAYDGGYCPQGLSFEQRTELLATDRDEYRRRVDATLRKHFELVRTLTERGTYFFDYGNAFMATVFESGVTEIAKDGDSRNGFIWPSYVEDIMGPELFDYGYGPFRWVCLSGRHEDLVATDQAAMSCIDPDRRGQDRDNYIGIRDAESNDLVVGTQARILYQDAKGRVAIALRFNEMVRNGEIGPVMLGRDHHDVSGTDSPFRETSNIKDGSNVMADMATQCFAGNAARGMSLVTLHNGGGTGIGNAINGGFGLVLDGSERVDAVIRSGLLWDVMCGVARRGWARNEHSVETARAFNQESPQGHITLPYLVDDEVIDKVVSQ
ncbi:MAG: urocanate hydratase, partial [Cutibacterium granulosum]|nr:urocanate hydratase [Cutibacterium granulosum]